MGTSVRDGAPRRLTPSPAQSAAQTAFLFATIECAAPLVLALIVFGLCMQPTIFATNGRSTLIVRSSEVQYSDGMHSCTFAIVEVSLKSIEVPAVSSPVLVRASLVDCRRGWSAPLSAALSVSSIPPLLVSSRSSAVPAAVPRCVPLSADDLARCLASPARACSCSVARTRGLVPAMFPQKPIFPTWEQVAR